MIHVRSIAICFFVLYLIAGGMGASAKPPQLKLKQPKLAAKPDHDPRPAHLRFGPIPKIRIRSPKEFTVLTVHSSLSILGFVNSLNDARVNVDLFRVDKDGSEHRVIGFGSGLEPTPQGEGRFTVDLRPPEEGWPKGLSVVRAHIEGLKSVNAKVQVWFHSGKGAAEFPKTRAKPDVKYIDVSAPIDGKIAPAVGLKFDPDRRQQFILTGQLNRDQQLQRLSYNLVEKQTGVVIGGGTLRTLKGADGRLWFQFDPEDGGRFRKRKGEYELRFRSPRIANLWTVPLILK